MTDCEGGDLLLAGTACGQLLGHCTGLCVQALGSDLKTARWLSFSNEKHVRGVDTRDALCKLMCYLTYLFLCYSSCDDLCEYFQVEEERKIVSQSVQASEKQNGPRKDHCSLRRGDELHIHSSPGTCTPVALLQSFVKFFFF